MSQILLFCRRTFAVFMAFFLTFRSANRLRSIQRRRPELPWDAPEIQKVSRSWGQKVLSHLNVNVKVEGSPTAEPAIFVGNHLSYIDIVALYSFIHLCFVAKSEVGTWPIIGSATRIAGSLFVERSSARSRVEIAETLGNAVLKDHKKICIFPEGTTSICGKAWRKGVFRVAKEKNLLIQPMAFAYKPIRKAAYIDDDTLLFHMWSMRGVEATELKIKFFEARKIESTETDMRSIEKEVREWVDAELRQQNYVAEQVGYTE